MSRRFLNPIAITDTTDSSITTAGGIQSTASQLNLTSATGTFAFQPTVASPSSMMITSDESNGRFILGTSGGQALSLGTGNPCLTLNIDNTINVMNNRLINLTAPVAGTDAVNKSYVDTQVAGNLSAAGGTTNSNFVLTNATTNSNLPNLVLQNTAGGATNRVLLSMTPDNNRTGGFASQIASVYNGGGADLLFRTTTASSTSSLTDRLLLTAAGNVGIGSTSGSITAASRLSITTSTPEYKISLYDGAGSNKSGFGYNSSGLYYTVDAATLSHTFYTAHTTNRVLSLGGAADGFAIVGPTTTSADARLNIQDRAGGLLAYYTNNTKYGSVSLSSNHVTYNSFNDTIFQTGTSNERMRVIGGTGYVGIGTSTPASLLTVASNNGTNLNEPYITLNGGGGATSSCGISMATTGLGVNARQGGYPVTIRCLDDGNGAAHLKFMTAPTGAALPAVDRMIITAQGTVGINTNAPQAQLHVATSGSTQALHCGPSTWTGDDAISRFSGVYSSNTVASFYHSGNAVPQTYHKFFSSNTVIGSISSTTAGQLQFNTTSDRRLKENIVDLTSEEAGRLDDIAVRVFNFKADEKKTPVVGFIAQEVVEVIPQAVTEPSDPETGTWMMNEMRIVPYLVKAVQDLRRDNMEMKARLAALNV